jgi:hypothetical protein
MSKRRKEPITGEHVKMIRKAKMMLGMTQKAIVAQTEYTKAFFRVPVMRR